MSLGGSGRHKLTVAGVNQGRESLTTKEMRRKLTMTVAGLAPHRIQISFIKIGAIIPC